MNNKSSSPKIGFALGSGASRGWSHIGVIKALKAEGIDPDIVCGTSVGAIIGGSYAAGNMGKLEEWVLSSTRTDVLSFFDVNLRQSGFVDSKRLNKFLHNYVAGEEQLDRVSRSHVHDPEGDHRDRDEGQAQQEDVADRGRIGRRCQGIDGDAGPVSGGTG